MTGRGIRARSHHIHTPSVQNTPRATQARPAHPPAQRGSRAIVEVKAAGTLTPRTHARIVSRALMGSHPVSAAPS